MRTSVGVGQWTRYFAVGSAVFLVVLQASRLLRMTMYTRAVLGLFGVVLPMIFGMGYLLFPSYAGRTLATSWIPVVHLPLAYFGASSVAVAFAFERDGILLTVGVGSWSLGVLLYVGVLAYTITPAIISNLSDVTELIKSPSGPQWLATALIPVAIGYLLLGTGRLVATTLVSPAGTGRGFPAVVHYYGVGVASLLIFALGVRLLSGFFDVELPRYGSLIVVLSGGLAPALLASYFGDEPWFQIGGGLLVVAVVGYGYLVGLVALRTPRRRLSLLGIGLGAGFGIAGVLSAVSILVAAVGAPPLQVHVRLVLDGFLAVTIVGYAYQFFPVTTGQFRGATTGTTSATVLLLAAGISMDVVGILVSASTIRWFGSSLAVVGAVGYAYLLTRRLLGSN